jgi:predicted amidophosphoribosyltransferase
MRVCPTCSEQHEEVFECCWRCGTSLVLNAIPADDETALEGGPPSLGALALQFSADENEANEINESDVKSCPSCGEAHEAAFETCWKCGALLTEDGDTVAGLAEVLENEPSDEAERPSDNVGVRERTLRDDPALNADPIEDPRACSQCGHPVRELAHFCVRCGARLGEAS